MTTTHEDGHGGHVTILEHGSATTPMRFHAIQPMGVAPPAPECHPSQSEDYKIIRGTLDLGVIDGKRVRLRAGDTYHLPAGVYHLPANGGEGELEYESVLTPGFESADMFGDLYVVIREYRGFAQFVRVAMVLRRYTRVIAFKAPVRAAMIVIAAFARLLGVRSAPADGASPSRAARGQ